MSEPEQQRRRRVDEGMAVDSEDDTLSPDHEQSAADELARPLQPGEQDIPEPVRRLRDYRGHGGDG